MSAQIFDMSALDDDEVNDIMIADQEYEDSLDEDAVLSDDDIASIIDNEISTATNYYEDELNKVHAQALNYYFGKPRGDEVEGRSKAISMDVADMVEATLAEVMPLYSNPRIAVFNPTNEGDERQARIETNICNDIFMESNNGYTVIYKAVKDALLQKYACVDVYIDEYEKVTYEEYEGLNQMQLFEVITPENEDQERIVTKLEINEETETAEIEIKIIQTVRELVVEDFAPEDFLYSISHRDSSAEGMPFCARRMIKTASELIAWGIDEEVVEMLPEYGSDVNPAQLARNQLTTEDEYNYSDDSQKPIEVFKCFALIDYDLDGIAELHEIYYAGDRVIRRKFCKAITFATGTPFIASHRFAGLSLFDKLKDTQDNKTSFVRQMHDNARQMNNRRLEVVVPNVNLEDVLVSRPGGVIRSKVKGSVNPIPVDDIIPSCISALEYLDTVRAERGGAALDMQSAALQVGGNAAYSTERQYQSKEKMAALISRTLAETLIKSIYLKIHFALREGYTQSYNMKINDEWVTSKPIEWLPRHRIKIDVGMSKAERQEKVQTLHGTLELQMKAMETESDGVLVNLEKIHNTIMDLSYCSGLDHPERYWIDPTSEQAQQTLKQKEQQSKADQKNMQLMQQMMMKFQESIEQQRNQIKIMQEESRRASENQDRMLKLLMHNDKMRKEYTELEVQNNVDIPGEGAGDA